jgi:primosomal protein N' (replication factor Y)
MEVSSCTSGPAKASSSFGATWFALASRSRWLLEVFLCGTLNTGHDVAASGDLKALAVVNVAALYVSVAILDAPSTTEGVYDYIVPTSVPGGDAFGDAGLGTVVIVPLRNRLARGVVVDQPERPAVDRGLKTVHALVCGLSPVSAEFLELARWMSAAYVCPVGRCLSALLPPLSGRAGGGTGAVKARERAAFGLAVSRDEADRLLGDLPLAATARRRALGALLDQGDGRGARWDNKDRAALTWLVEQGVAVRRREETQPVDLGSEGGALLVPTPEQQAALGRIETALEARKTAAFLLRGVTGSGKTEVYRRGAAAALRQGRGALILVPEIALTPQVIEWFRSAFGRTVAVLHSRLSAGERASEWERIRRGEARVVVGARLAVFAPVEDLGLIVVDEEQESTYHQEEDPKYDAREIALWRAVRHRAVLVLGSATPSLEAMEACRRREMELLTLSVRVDGRALPAVSVVDMRDELKAGNRGIFSRALRSAMEHTLARGHQVILFLNRRGYSTFVLCRGCGYVARCPQCAVSLTLHEDDGRLVCHYCGFRKEPPKTCPACGGTAVRGFGAGTERVAAEAGRLAPHARVLRMDLDTTSVKGEHGRIVRAFRRGEADILVGTQMVAKGLDFPNVALVGVVSADITLNLPDFRAAERTFQLLVQAAGRAGRGGPPGKVIIQTYSPDHYSVTNAASHDYESFAAAEREIRQALRCPPFSRLARSLYSAVEAERALQAAHRSLKEIASLPVEILGPAPSPLSRLKGRHRIQVVLRAEDAEPLREAGRRLLRAAGAAGWDSKVGLTFEMDPRSIL